MASRAAYTTPEGYLMAWDELQSRYRPAHVLIWEKTNGCAVTPGWHIHHRDFDRHNNDPTNLQEIDPTSHRRLHAGWELDDLGRWWKRCGDCGELKLIDDFYARSNGVTYSYCRRCQRLRNRRNEASARERRRQSRTRDSRRPAAPANSPSTQLNVEGSTTTSAGFALPLY